MRISPFQAMFPNRDLITSTESFFSVAKAEFPTYRENGFLNKADHASIFIYQIDCADRTFTGVVACADLEEYLNKKIKKHENTLAHKEASQLQLLIQRKANIKPVLLTYHPVAAINKFINDFLLKNKSDHSFHFASEQTTHKFFEITDATEIKELQNLFEQKVPKTFIADGHHRCSTNALFYEGKKKINQGEGYRNLLCAFFPSNELQIYDFNRIVEVPKNISSNQLMARLSEVFDLKFLESAQKPTTKHELTLLIKNEWYSLKWKATILEKYKDQKVVLDANLLDDHILKPVFGIEDIKTTTQIKYIEGVKPIQEIIDKTKKEKRVAFCIYPVKMEELLLVADQNKVMPPKSTWFEPRMKNGLVCQDFDHLS